MTRKFHINNGFTLIELVVVATVIVILSTISIAAFANFDKSQTIHAATTRVTTMLQKAKSRAQSQVKPPIGTCVTNTLESYEVQICGLSGSDCSTPNTFRLMVRCGGTANEVETDTLPQTTSFTAGSAKSVLFRLFTGGVDGAITPKTIIITSGVNQTQTITITSVGSISVE